MEYFWQNNECKNDKISGLLIILLASNMHFRASDDLSNFHSKHSMTSEFCLVIICESTYLAGQILKWLWNIAHTSWLSGIELIVCIDYLMCVLYKKNEILMETFVFDSQSVVECYIQLLTSPSWQVFFVVALICLLIFENEKCSHLEHR